MEDVQSQGEKPQAGHLNKDNIWLFKTCMLPFFEGHLGIPVFLNV